MPTSKPTKPSITLPTAFGTSSSNVKTPFTAQELLNGFSASIPQVLDGGNLNYMIDAMFQYLTWSNKYADWYANGSPNTVPYINSSNQLDYASPVFGGANNTFTGTNTFTGNISSSGTNTLSGNNTFSGSVSLGSYATATTQLSSDNSTKVATTAYVQSRVCTTPATTTSTASANTPAYIVENYRNSSTGEWYRIWSDGWIEQGYNGSSSTTVTTYEFLKPFSDDSYTLVFGAATINQYWTNKTASGFKFNSNSSGARSWYACGY